MTIIAINFKLEWNTNFELYSFFDAIFFHISGKENKIKKFARDEYLFWFISFQNRTSVNVCVTVPHALVCMKH